MYHITSNVSSDSSFINDAFGFDHSECWTYIKKLKGLIGQGGSLVPSWNPARLPGWPWQTARGHCLGPKREFQILKDDPWEAPKGVPDLHPHPHLEPLVFGASSLELFIYCGFSWNPMSQLRCFCFPLFSWCSTFRLWAQELGIVANKPLYVREA